MDDCLSVILKYFNIRDLVNFSLINKEWYKRVHKKRKEFQYKYIKNSLLTKDVLLMTHQLRLLEIEDTKWSLTPGSGKKIPLLIKLKHTKDNLIVCSNNSLSSWKNEMDKHFPSMNYYIYHRSYNKNLNDDFKNYNVILTSYHMLTKTTSFYPMLWNYIVLSESYHIDNKNNETSKRINYLLHKNSLTYIDNNMCQIYTYSGLPQVKFKDYEVVGSKDFYNSYDGNKKFCISPELCDNALESPKISKIREIISKNKKIIITSEFNDALSWLKLHINPSVLITCKTKNKEAYIKKFTEEDQQVLMMSSKIIIGSWDLSISNCMVFLEPWNDTFKVKKAIGRIARRGQKEPCTIYNIRVKDTVEM